MTIPNLISIGRLLAVPVMVWALIDGRWGIAFITFVVAGISDAIDGAIARHFNQQSTLGLYLDPIADKALLSTVFIGLGLLGRLPDWLVIAVVSRDVLIVAAVMLSSIMGLPMTVRPLFISKANTAAQIVLAASVLGESALGVRLGGISELMVGLTLVLTIASAAAYLIDWLRHMASPDEPDPGESDRP
ncbi:CDP-alcohol phosphatidyltransferase family protein [Jiella sp. MQZ9-1]|uniref:CDP-diacylglycerol--glycerol-3-phosphate 3-phosphatidyltransferase n=1 Tax=Jiella flava TaxID=2816857 RepID=A0A939FY42_9HYPH|nr:CDP-alcohol phosphatidyltransferase family protein [Jiella flava]MBO0662336.1 CDP-alcohol phosphatidyltransferase family protein [Jiella flava]MCD2470835.1 CDP-alcohol phosphatidyltransferase family protein [Jiella flava]